MSESLQSAEQPGVINAFGLPVYEIKEVVSDKAIESVVRLMRRDVFRYLGIPDEKSDAELEECLQFACNYGKVSDYERSAHNVLEREGIAKAIPVKFDERARIIQRQIQPYLLPGSVLDLGCGDARLAQLLAEAGFTLQLADVYENPNVACTGLPFKLLKQSGIVSFNDNLFDNTLLLTVLHHCQYPVLVLQEAHRVTRANGRVIVIESVYGVNGEELSPVKRAQVEQYLVLTSEQQRRVNIFFDHFYNRVIHYTDDPTQKVNVPYNFNTPEMWKTLFEQNGFRQEQVVHLGPDQPTVPEYHTLHVLTALK